MPIMIRALSFLFFLASVVLADPQECGDIEETSYILFDGQLKEGQTIDQYCEYQLKFLEGEGYLEGKTVDCSLNPVISTLEFESLPYIEGSGCNECLVDCKTIVGDHNTICEAIIIPSDGSVRHVTTLPFAPLFRIHILIVITKYSVSICIWW